jgi:hypothetical protein
MRRRSIAIAIATSAGAGQCPHEVGHTGRANAIAREIERGARVGDQSLGGRLLLRLRRRQRGEGGGEGGRV